MRLLDRRRLAYVLLSAFVLSAAITAGACFTHDSGPDCENPDYNHHDKNGDFDPCHCDDDAGTVGGRGGLACFWFVPEDAGADGPIEGGPILTDAAVDAPSDSGPEPADAAADGALASCAGQCWPSPPAGWTSPMLLAIGDQSGALPCPSAAPVIGYEGHGGLDAPDATCGACSCALPSGSCAAPTTIAAGNMPCSEVSTVQVSFNPPNPWSAGVCAGNVTIAGGALCNGAACVQSVTIGSLTLTETGCNPLVSAGAMVPPPAWTSFARSCTSTGGMCASLGEICGPPSAPGFQVCIFQQGDIDCPSFSPYSEKHVFYQGVDDTRGCSPCACSSPVGSMCSAMVSIYSDTLCNNSVGSAMLGAQGPQCVNVKKGTALGSKAMEPAVYIAGQCQPSGGEVVGVAKPLSPATFCCLPPI